MKFGTLNDSETGSYLLRPRWRISTIALKVIEIFLEFVNLHIEVISNPFSHGVGWSLHGTSWWLATGWAVSPHVHKSWMCKARLREGYSSGRVVEAPLPYLSGCDENENFFLSNLMFETRTSFFQSHASRREQKLSFSILGFETRTWIKIDKMCAFFSISGFKTKARIKIEKMCAFFFLRITLLLVY